VVKRIEHPIAMLRRDAAAVVGTSTFTFEPVWLVRMTIFLAVHLLHTGSVARQH
jgi:hypothetical protein